MRRTVVVALVVASLAAVVSSVGGLRGTEEQRPQPAPQPQADAAASRSAEDAYGRLPLAFEANVGQTDPEVAFTAAGSGYRLFLTSTEAVLAVQPSAGAGTGAAVRLVPEGANLHPEVVGLAPLPGRVSYLRRSDPRAWQRDVPTYGRVAQRDVWDGIDLVYYGNRGAVEYDMVVAPGADPAAIRLRMAGVDDMRVEADGSLGLATAAGSLHQRPPVAYQEVAGERRPVDAAYALDGHTLSVRLGPYDSSKQLVIDPVLAYSTFLGGSYLESGHGIALDGSGSAYVTGETLSVDFPATAGAFDTGLASSGDAFVAKLDPTGSSLVYATYLGGGGGGTEEGNAIAVDAGGHAYVTGSTESFDFPITPGAFDSRLGGEVDDGFQGEAADAFVSKLDPTGSTLVYSTFLGGRESDAGAGIAVDGAGHAYVTGTTGGDFPTTRGAFQETPNGGCCSRFGGEVFVVKLDPSASTLMYGTYIGGIGTDVAADIALDGSGNAYVTGQTASSDFPTTPGAFDRTSATTDVFSGSDAFVAKLDPAGSSLAYATYIGGARHDSGSGIAVDSAGHAYVTGLTGSTDFPVTRAAFDTTGGTNPYDVFVTKLDVVGSSLEYATYLGGTGTDIGADIGIDAGGHAYVTGNACSADFPTTPGAVDDSLGSFCDAFMAKLDAVGTALLYSTYLGGNDGDTGEAIAVDGSGSAYVTGQTFSPDFPVTPGAFDTTLAPPTPLGFPDREAFVSKLSPPTDETPPAVGRMWLTISANPASGPAPLPVTYTYTLTNDGNDPIFHTTVADDSCGPVTLQAGDTNGDEILDPSEQWTLTCRQTLSTTNTSTAVAQGTSTRSGLDVTSNTVQTTVTVGGTAPTTTAPTSTSAVANTTTTTAPSGSGAPTNLRITSRDTSTAGIAWNAVAGATEYRAYVSRTSGSGYFLWASGLTGTSATLYSLTGDFYVVVRAVVGGVESANSNEVLAAADGTVQPTTTTTTTVSSSTTSTTSTTAPSSSGAPTNLTLTSRTPSTAGISWNPVAGATEYRAYVSRTSGSGYFLWASGFTGTSATLYSLTGDFYVVVRAVVGGVESPNSNEVLAAAP